MNQLWIGATARGRVVTWHETLLDLAGRAQVVRASGTGSWVTVEGSGDDFAVRIEGVVGLRGWGPVAPGSWSQLPGSAAWHDMAPLSGDWVGEVCVDEGTVLIGAPGRVAEERANWLREPVPAALPPTAALPAELIRLREAVEGDEIVALMIDDAIIGFRVTESPDTELHAWLEVPALDNPNQAAGRPA